MITSTTSELAAKKTDIDLPCLMVSYKTGTVYLVHTRIPQGKYSGNMIGTLEKSNEGNVQVGYLHHHINITDYYLYEGDITLRNVL